MIIITLDKGLDTERSIEVDRITERPITQTITGSKAVPISSIDDIPDLSDFVTPNGFSTFTAESGVGHVLPTSDAYNAVTDAIINYDGSNENGICSITLTFGVFAK